MDKNKFANLFRQCSMRALEDAQRRLNMVLSDDFDVELHGAGVSGDIILRDRAIDLMYISEDKFYRVIDIAVKRVVTNRAVLFVRISAHEPSSFQHTWNAATGFGPFKVIESKSIKIEN